jgi:NTP pyrophosphatase (non-canonical NTP hydrolase)
MKESWCLVTPSLPLNVRIFLEIVEERRRQDFLKSQGKFTHTCADAMPASMKLAVLAEEFGEVARAVCERDYANLREDLVQVAAVSLAWLEALDAGR